MKKLKNLSLPKGRMRRTNYILWQILCQSVFIILYDVFIYYPMYSGYSVKKSEMFILLVFLIVLFSLEFYLTYKRLQDCRFPGWYCLLLFIPIIFEIIILILCLYPGTKGVNKFGLDPRDKNKKEQDISNPDEVY
ncbi:DUF805 domain-containing protein [Flavobacterium sp.]|uniref:DUF805 domain-containing protein n=1 Tax=Flavobacterium sp. TaxID=239 RepID=UPI0038FC01E2